MNNYKPGHMRMVELVILIRGFLPKRNEPLQKDCGTRGMIRCWIHELRTLRHVPC